MKCLASSNRCGAESVLLFVILNLSKLTIKRKLGCNLTTDPGCFQGRRAAFKPQCTSVFVFLSDVFECFLELQCVLESKNIKGGVAPKHSFSSLLTKMRILTALIGLCGSFGLCGNRSAAQRHLLPKEKSIYSHNKGGGGGLHSQEVRDTNCLRY